MSLLEVRDLAVSFRFGEYVSSVSGHGAGTLTEMVFFFNINDYSVM